MLEVNRSTGQGLRDTSNAIRASDNTMSVRLSFTKTHKLVTALYMVTDIIDQEEPLRNKLRTLGLQVLSDTDNLSVPRSGLLVSINEIISLLNIASAMNFISQMNCNILTKEFIDLKASMPSHLEIKDSWLEDFLGDSSLEAEKDKILQNVSRPQSGSFRDRRNLISKGHANIGVQKGSTLMKALSDTTNFLSDIKNQPTLAMRSHFEIIKKQRRDNIIKIIKNNEGAATIKDILGQINIGVKGTLSCSEKTLQRELMSMIKDGVLNKEGAKRWSRYFIGS